MVPPPRWLIGRSLVACWFRGASPATRASNGMVRASRHSPPSSIRACGGGLLLALLAFYCGCNKPAPPANSGEEGPTQRKTQVLHEECAITAPAAERLDANGDGRADITIVKNQGREVCRAADINFDGVVDTWSYSDASGQLRRREHDFDRDGQIDEIAIYQAGVVREK